MKHRGDLIDGRFVRARGDGDGALEARDADSGEVFASYPIRRESVHEALEAARRAAPRWGESDAEQRAAGFKRLEAQLRNRADELARAITREVGLPAWEAHAEVAQALEVTRAALAAVSVGGPLAGAAAQARGPRTWLERRARGAVTVIAPYPQPLLLLHTDVVAAVAAGCPVVAKPTSRAPAFAELYAALLEEADLGRGVVNVIAAGDSDSARELAAGESDVLLFSGSQRVALPLVRELAERAPGRRARVLGSGRGAALLLADANIEQALLHVVSGALAGAGQRCTSTRRVIVERPLLEDARTRLRELLERVVVGAPSQADSAMGPLVGEDLARRFLAEHKRVAALDGAQSVLAPTRLSRRGGAYVRPGLVEVPPAQLEAALADDPCGPLLVLCPCDSPEHGVELINSSPDGLCMSVFARDDLRRAAVRDAQRVGLCVFDGPTTAWPCERLPLAASGTASIGGAAGLAATMQLCQRGAAVIELAPEIDQTMLPPGLIG